MLVTDSPSGRSAARACALPPRSEASDAGRRSVCGSPPGVP